MHAAILYCGFFYCGDHLWIWLELIAAIEKAAIKKIIQYFFIAPFLLRPPQQPAEVAAKAMPHLSPKQSFCAAIEASLYDASFNTSKKEDFVLTRPMKQKYCPCFFRSCVLILRTVAYKHSNSFLHFFEQTIYRRFLCRYRISLL